MDQILCELVSAITKSRYLDYSFHTISINILFHDIQKNIATWIVRLVFREPKISLSMGSSLILFLFIFLTIYTQR